MVDLLQTGSDWLSDQLRRHASQSVVYVRGTDVLTVAATIGRTVFETTSDTGLVERSESRDYLIQAVDLVWGAPRRGDQIREAQGDIIYVYEVMAPGKEPAFRFSDPFRKAYRIHTKLVDTLTAAPAAIALLEGGRLAILDGGLLLLV